MLPLLIKQRTKFWASGEWRHTSAACAQRGARWIRGLALPTETHKKNAPYSILPFHHTGLDFYLSYSGIRHCSSRQQRCKMKKRQINTFITLAAQISRLALSQQRSRNSAHAQMTRFRPKSKSQECHQIQIIFLLQMKRNII